MSCQVRRDEIVNRILRYPSSIGARMRGAWLSILGAKIGKDCRLLAIDIPRNPWDVEIAEGVAMEAGVTLLSTGARKMTPRIRIGRNCYINRRVFLDACELIEIGANCMIGPDCYITDHDHGKRTGELISAQALVSRPVHIGSNVWIGAGAIILKGVRVGDGAVIGAGSVVNRDVPMNSVVAGVPARAIEPLGQQGQCG
ncbi:acyltransferase [Thermohalobaculum sediminis]|uniref:acyltransferase n=1 Tax=Thermohalobaculum sediminis TaxID=2939436 RepID=UPI0029E81902|nr:acyltransferase [Limibaculum sediminis]